MKVCSCGACKNSECPRKTQIRKLIALLKEIQKAKSK